MTSTMGHETGLRMLKTFGQYPYSNTFQANDEMAGMEDSVPVAQAYSAAFDADSGVKRHAACDDCRKRKLKCSGELAGCTRCIKQNLVCHFSEQKQMGRPRKKQKISEETDAQGTQENSFEVQSAAQPSSSQHVANPDNRGAFEAVCPGPLTQYIKNYTPSPRQPFLAETTIYEQNNGSFTSETSPPSNDPTTPPSNVMSDPIYPTDVALWPDYSTMLMLPMVVQAAHEHEKDPFKQPDLDQSSVSSPDMYAAPNSLTTLPSVPACPCLPNLYLTLSTLSTLSSFPVSTHTIETLQTGARTAHSVLYCTICPQRFQTGMQNVMLLGTLLSVLGDGWHRLHKAKPEDLRRGFCPSASMSLLAASVSCAGEMTARQKLEWSTFGHELIRCNVFGDSLPPTPPGPPGSSPPTSPAPAANTQLLYLVDAMERRQSHWHNPEMATGEFIERMKQKVLLADGTTCDEDRLQGTTLADIQAAEMDVQDGRHLCLRIVEGARKLCKKLDLQPPTFPV